MSGGGHGLFTVHGMGGHIAVFEERIEIHRHGLLHMVLEVLNLYEGSTDITIPIDRITSIAIIEPWLEPGYIRFSYAGSPAYTKHYWEDAMTPATLLMGFFDTRDFHRLREYLLARQAGVDAHAAMARMDAHGDHGHADHGHDDGVHDHGDGDHGHRDEDRGRSGARRESEPAPHAEAAGEHAPESGHAPETAPVAGAAMPRPVTRAATDAERATDWRDRYRSRGRDRYYVRDWRPEE